MGRAKKTRKIQKTKRKSSVSGAKKIIHSNDGRIRKNLKHELISESEDLKRKKLLNAAEIESIVERPQPSSSMFFEYNTNLGPPYLVLVDTNFINFSIQNKLDVLESMMECLVAKTIPCVTDCVVGELEKMGHRFRLALRLVKDPRFRRLTCTHTGTYADDCIVNRITEHKCYIVATNDKDLKRRIRKTPGVPIMFVSKRKYAIERMPDGMSAIPLKK
eukprot:Lankesteria_metandrocarpae@DN3030_c0_g1_i1.p1